jgi:hypothetical protein
MALRESRADRYANEQFKHTAGSGAYIEEEELAQFPRWIECWGGEAVELIE